MRRALSPGDVVIYRAGGRRMRALVAVHLPMRTRGEELWVGICKRGDGRKVHWMPRSALRKAVFNAEAQSRGGQP